MTSKIFYTIFTEAVNDKNKEQFVSVWTLSSIFDESKDLTRLSQEVAAIWDIAHLSTNEIREATGLSQEKFAEHATFWGLQL